jgi:hypothetical protein
MDDFKITAVGFPDFWQTAHDKFPNAFGAIHNLIPLQQAMFAKPLGTPLHKVIRHISKMTLNSLGALTTLALNGYGNDAMKIARGMFEAAVTISYLQNHPSELQDYLDYHWVNRRKWVEYIKRTCPEVLETRAAEVAQIMEEYAKVENKFKDKRGRHRESWCTKSIAERAKEAGMSDNYQTFYRWASSMEHVDIGGITAQVDGNDVDVAPSLAWVDIALVTGHSAAIHCLVVLNGVASLGMEAEIQKAMDEFQTAW